MAEKKLFEGTHNPTPQDSRRIAIGYAGIEGSEYVEVSELADQTLTDVVNIKFAPQSTLPTFGEGKLWYDNNKKALSYYNEESDVSVNLGQELLFRVYNSSGATIANGKVVTPFGSTIALADCYDKHKSRLLAVATHDIENNSWGYVTKFGQVGGLDTSSFTAGDVIYLGSNGDFTTDTPVDGGYICIVGVVDEVSSTVGIITVDTKSSDTTVEVTDTNGFPLDQVTATSLSFVDVTRTFTIAPTGAEFHYYQLGDKYGKTTAQNVVIANSTGVHVIYFNGETLSTIFAPTESQVRDIILNKCIVAFVYWNATTSYSVLINDERHGIGMTPFEHLYNHLTRGAQYISGLAIENIVIGNGSLNSHAQFGTALGQFADEDLFQSIDAVASTVGLKFLYKFGASGDWRFGTNAGYSFPVGSNSLPQFNQWTGSTWQLTEVTSTSYMLLHIFACADLPKKPVCFLGTAQYTSVALASAGAPNELTTLLTGLPLPEFVPMATLILEVRTTFDNAVNARIVANSNGDNYFNWLKTEISSTQTPTNHNNLSGLQAAGTGVTWGHVNEELFNQIQGGKYKQLLATTDFSTSAASTSTITMLTDKTSVIFPGMAIRFTLSGVVYYAICTAITSNLLTIAGAPLTTGSGALTALSYSDFPDATHAETIVVNGAFADAINTAVIENDLLVKGGLIWKRSKAYLAQVGIICTNLDSGTVTTQAKVNAKINALDVLSSDLTVNTTLVNSVVQITTANYDVNFGEAIELTVPVLAAGTSPNNDALNLTVYLTFVYP